MARPFHSFVRELKRRRVGRVAAAYAATAFVVVEAADLFVPRLGLPDGFVTALVVLAAAGFPVALVLGWIYDIAPGRVSRTEPGPGEARLEPSRRLALLTVGGAVGLLVGVGWWAWGGAAGAPPTIDRLAVLPLVNLMNDPDQDYFVEGMHDRLISELQQAGVAVIARTSVLPYQRGEKPIREIASELGVDAVIEGSVFRAADSVTIEARLVDGVTEQYLWRQSYRGDLRNVAALHRDLTRAIAAEIRREVEPAAAGRFSEARPVDPRAYEAYLKGTFHLHRFTEEDLDTALRYFERALAVDSTYAPAWVGLAKVWQFRDVPPGVARARAEPALDRALALDPDLAEAHFARAASLAWGDWDWVAADASFERAIALNPGFAEGRMFYSHLLTILGEWSEAARQADLGLALDPLNPFIRAMHATQLSVHDPEEATRSLRAALDANPGAGFGRETLAATLGAIGRYDEALELWTEIYDGRGEADVVAAIDRGYARGGYRSAYREAADVLSSGLRPRHTPPVGIAAFYVHAGAHERALDLLERAFAEHDTNLPYLGVIPELRPLHDHPRFLELTRRVNVPVVVGGRGLSAGRPAHSF